MPGGLVGYTITVTNEEGPSAAPNPYIIDQLGSSDEEDFYFEVATLPDGCYLIDENDDPISGAARGQRVLCDSSALGYSTLSDNQTAEITLYARLDPNYDGDGSDLTQQVRPGSDYVGENSSFNDFLIGSGPHEDDYAEFGGRQADLDVTKSLDTVNNSAREPIFSADPDVDHTGATPGQLLDYSVTVNNLGPSTVLGTV